jgi:hypothetical protein
MTHVHFEKDPSAKKDYMLDWSAWLGSDTITTSTWTVLPTGITKDSDSKTATTTTVWLSGGVIDAEYRITNLIETVGGRKESRGFTVLMRST